MTNISARNVESTAGRDRPREVGAVLESWMN